MANPIEDLHAFDLHIYVGSRSWPDDIELYCSVIYPGLDAEHPIEINYMHLISGYSLDDAIRQASADIGAYMQNPEGWIQAHIKGKGTIWEKRRTLELEIAYRHKVIADYQENIAGNREQLAEAEQQLQRLEQMP